MIPNPTRPDYYWENQYYLDEEKAEREAMERSGKAAAKNTGQLFSLLFKFLFGALLWTSGLITAYFIVMGSNSFNQFSILQKTALIIGMAYLINCVIFFLKGIMTTLRSSGRKTWVLLWLINCGFICLPPAILIYLTLDNFMTKTKESSNPNLLGIAAGILIAILVYSKFGLSSARTPKIFYWIFRIGYNVLK